MVDVWFLVGALVVVCGCFVVCLGWICVCGGCIYGGWVWVWFCGFWGACWLTLLWCWLLVFIWFMFAFITVVG